MTEVARSWNPLPYPFRGDPGGHPLAALPPRSLGLPTPPQGIFPFLLSSWAQPDRQKFTLIVTGNSVAIASILGRWAYASLSSKLHPRLGFSCDPWASAPRESRVPSWLTSGITPQIAKCCLNSSIHPQDRNFLRPSPGKSPGFK